MRITFILLALLLLSPMTAQDLDELWDACRHAIEDEEWSQALSIAQKALVLSQQEERDSLAVAIRLTLGDIYYHLGEIDAAVRETRNAALELHEGADESLRLKAYYQLGIYFQSKGMYRGSSEYFKRASELAIARNDLSMVAEIYRHMGENAQRSGRYDEALEFSYKAVDLYRELSDEASLALVYNNLSTIYRKLGRYDQAVDFLTKAQIINMNTQNLVQVGDNYYNLGQIYIDRHHLSTARQYFNRAMRIYNDTDHHHGIVQSLLALASVALGGEDPDEAVALANQAPERTQHNSDERLMPRVLLTLGRIKLQQGENQAAYTYLEQALNIAKQLSTPDDLLNIFQVLSIAHEQDGSYRQSLVYYKAFDSLKDSLRNEDSRQKVAEMQTVYEYFEKEKEIDQLRSKLLVEQVNREKERLRHESELEIARIRNETERRELQNQLRLEQITSERRKLLLENERMTNEQQRLELQNAQIRTRHQRQFLLLSVVGLVILAGFVIVVVQRYRHERLLRSKIDSQKRELEDAYHKLQEAHRQKVELEQLRSVMAMSVTMNHELNQPLMIIQGNLEMLEHAIACGDTPGKYIERIQMSVERISHLLEKIRRMEDISFQHYGGGSDMIDLKQQETDDEYARGADLDDEDLDRIGSLLQQKPCQNGGS